MVLALGAPKRQRDYPLYGGREIGVEAVDAAKKMERREICGYAISRAVHQERERCARIAESFTREAKTEEELWFVRRIAEVIRLASVKK